MTKTLKATLLAGAMTLGLAGAANAQTAFSLDQDGSSLVRFSPSGGTASGTALTGTDGAAISLDALTYRAQTNQLYGFDGSSGTLYTVDINTGVATDVFQSSQLPDGFVQFEINNNLDAFRFISASGANVVYFPENTADTMDRGGLLITDAPTINPITYGDGFGSDASGTPALIGNGYSNQLPAVQARAQDDPLIQFALDAATNSLVELNNNAGTIDFLGDAGFDFDIAGGYDTFSDGDSDIGYALLTVNGEQALYSIDLTSYVFSRVLGIQDDFGTLTSLAVFDADAVPVPAAALLFLTGAGGLAAARKRRAAKA